MFSVKILSSDMKDRLDANFYHPEYLEVEHKLKQLGATTLDSLCHGVECGPFGGNAIADDLYAKQGIAFIRPVNISSHIFDKSALVKVPEQLLINHKLKIYNQTNLYFGRVGDPCVAVIACKTSISPNIIVAKTNADLADPYYLWAFSACTFGLNQLLRQLKTVAQPTTSTESVRNLSVFNTTSEVQKYIGDKVRQAEQLRAWAKRLEAFIDQQISFLVQNAPNPQKHYFVKPFDLSPYRINPKQYDPIATSAISKAQDSGILLEKLENLIDARGITGGATPKGANYQTSGVLFCRVQNVKKLALDLSNAVYINKDDDESLKRSRCNKFDIVLTITGYPGTASLVIEEDLPVNLNQHSVRFGCSANIKPGYLCAVLNSAFLKLQVDRASIGGTRDALDYPSVTNLLIPRLNAHLEEDIHNAALNYIKAIKASKQLTNIAKTLVEDLIEGQLTEQQLIQAQQALEDGDNTLDQAILGKLSAEAYVIEGATPLFSDLDELYRLLAKAAQLEADD